MREKKKERKAKVKRKKGQFILFERARLKKQKTNRKSCETTKEMEQKQFYKKGMNK